MKYCKHKSTFKLSLALMSGHEFGQEVVNYILFIILNFVFLMVRSPYFKFTKYNKCSSVYTEFHIFQFQE
jgi:hypothetical protein